MNKFLYFLSTTDRFILIPLAFSCFCIFFIVGNFVILYNYLPAKLPLFYSLPWGQSQLILKQQFLILPALLIFFSLVNTFIAAQLHNIQVIIKRMLTLSIVLIDLIILITAIKILFIFV